MVGGAFVLVCFPLVVFFPPTVKFLTSLERKTNKFQKPDFSGNSMGRIQGTLAKVLREERWPREYALTLP